MGTLNKNCSGVLRWVCQQPNPTDELGTAQKLHVHEELNRSQIIISEWSGDPGGAMVTEHGGVCF
jgi:hypothetical protein